MSGGYVSGGAVDGGYLREAGRTGAGGNGTTGPRVAGVVLRDMRWWDLSAVLDLEHDLFPEDAWSRGMFWSELADTGHPAATRTYLVAEVPGAGGAGGARLVGYAGLAAVGGTGDVQTIATARDHWGTGLGARLLTALLRAATAAECHEVLLEVRVDNPRAQRLYRRFGFEPIGLRRGYYQPGNVDALVMRLADPAGGDPAIGDQATGDPATGGLAIGDPITGHPATGAPAPGGPAAGDPSTRDPAAAGPARTVTGGEPPSVQETEIHG